MNRYVFFTMCGKPLVMVGIALLVTLSLLPITNPQPVYACYDWSVGQRVGLRRGAEIRTGNGLGYQVHTIVPEDNWQVDIIDGPQSGDGQEWWDISRRNLDGGGTGWVSKSQAAYDVCSGGGGGDGAGGGAPAGYAFCAQEGQSCDFSDTRDVAYGANGAFNYKAGITGGINCNNDTFGDPAYGTSKACYTKGVSNPDPPVPIPVPTPTPPPQAPTPDCFGDKGCVYKQFGFTNRVRARPGAVANQACGHGDNWIVTYDISKSQAWKNAAFERIRYWGPTIGDTAAGIVDYQEGKVLKLCLGRKYLLRVQVQNTWVWLFPD